MKAPNLLRLALSSGLTTLLLWKFYIVDRNPPLVVLDAQSPFEQSSQCRISTIRLNISGELDKDTAKAALQTQLDHNYTAEAFHQHRAAARIRAAIASREGFVATAIAQSETGFKVPSAVNDADFIFLDDEATFNSYLPHKSDKQAWLANRTLAVAKLLEQPGPPLVVVDDFPLYILRVCVCHFLETGSWRDFRLSLICS